jgi:hypothetical protein
VTKYDETEDVAVELLVAHVKAEHNDGSDSA